MDNTIENLLKDMEELRKRLLSINLPNAKENDLLWLVTSIEQDINKLEQPQGEWIYFLGCGVGRAMCSECGQLGDIKKYCGYCGAKMKLG